MRTASLPLSNATSIDVRCLNEPQYSNSSTRYVPRAIQAIHPPPFPRTRAGFVPSIAAEVCGAPRPLYHSMTRVGSSVQIASCQVWGDICVPIIHTNRSAIFTFPHICRNLSVCVCHSRCELQRTTTRLENSVSLASTEQHD